MHCAKEFEGARPLLTWLRDQTLRRSRTRMRVPWPGLLSNSSMPPCSCTMEATIANPSPLPSPGARGVFSEAEMVEDLALLFERGCSLRCFVRTCAPRLSLADVGSSAVE